MWGWPSTPQCSKHFNNKQQKTQPAEKNTDYKAVQCLQQISCIRACFPNPGLKGT